MILLSTPRNVSDSSRATGTKSKSPRKSQCFSPPSPPPSLLHLDHLLADSHQLVVELGVAHLHLLQSEDPLVAALTELLLLLLQTLDHLRSSAGEGNDMMEERGGRGTKHRCQKSL